MPVKMAIIIKTKNNKCWRGSRESEHSHTADGNANWCNHCGKTGWLFLKKLKMEPPQDPAMALLGIYPNNLKSTIQSNTCTPMFIAVSLTLAKTWKQPKCPLTDDWIKKMCYTYTMKYYSAIKKTKSSRLQQHGWTLRVLS